MADKEFIPGLSVKAPHEKAPEYVKARLSFKRADLLAFLQSQSDEWINVDVKVSQGGKWYAERDNWKPNQGGDRPQRQERKPAADYAATAEANRPNTQDMPFPDDDIPF